SACAAALAASALTSTVRPCAWKYPASFATTSGRYAEPVSTAPTFKALFSGGAPASGAVFGAAAPAGPAAWAARGAARAPARDGVDVGAAVQARASAAVSTAGRSHGAIPGISGEARRLMTHLPGEGSDDDTEPAVTDRGTRACAFL